MKLRIAQEQLHKVQESQKAVGLKLADCLRNFYGNLIALCQTGASADDNPATQLLFQWELLGTAKSILLSCQTTPEFDPAEAKAIAEDTAAKLCRYITIPNFSEQRDELVSGFEKFSADTTEAIQL